MTIGTKKCGLTTAGASWLDARVLPDRWPCQNRPQTGLELNNIAEIMALQKTNFAEKVIQILAESWPNKAYVHVVMAKVVCYGGDSAPHRTLD
jgi:hypothetical protein